MFTVKRDERFFVIDRNNKHYEFKSYEALLKWLAPYSTYNYYYLPWDRREEAKGKIVQVGHNWNDSGKNFIVFDSLWRVLNIKELKVDVEKFKKEQDKKHNVSYKQEFYKLCKSRHLNVGFRCAPVPHTRHYGHSSYYRRMRTTQELRRNCWEPKFARGKRRKKYLSNAWDDLPKSRRARYSWKNQRKEKQWM